MRVPLDVAGLIFSRGAGTLPRRIPPGRAPAVMGLTGAFGYGGTGELAPS